MSKNNIKLLTGILSVLIILLAEGINTLNQDKDIEIPSRTTETSITILNDMEELKYLSEEFSLQDAKDAGMLVLEGMTITSGLDQWNEFYKNVRSRKIDEIRIAKYYELGDASHYAPEYYEEIKDDYPVMYISLLKYDGKGYNLCYYEDSEFYSYNYKYMIEQVGHLSPTAEVADHFFALVNDKQLSYQDIKWSMISSNSADKVDHMDVFMENVSLENYNARKHGTYRSKEGSASLILYENCEFLFIREKVLSYSPVGRYYIEGDMLVLYVDDEEVYYFKMKGNGVLEFVSGEYAENVIEIGTKFLYETE